MPTIGAIPFAHINRMLLGQRVDVAGRLSGTALVAIRSGTAHEALVKLDMERISLKAYVAPGGSVLRLGSGLTIDGSFATGNGEELAVIIIQEERNRLVTTQVQTEGVSRSRSEDASAKKDGFRRSTGRRQGGARGGRR